MTNALQGAKFVLNHKNSDYKYETTLEDKLTLPNIPEGEYTYSLSKRGYETTTGTIYVGETGQFNLKLSLNKKKKNTKKEKKANTADDQK